MIIRPAVSPASFPDVKLLQPPRHSDARGFLSEVWCADTMRTSIGDVTFVQENHAYSRAPFTMRGLHFQVPPRAQAKLIRVTRGAIFDVAVDLRRGSPAFGRHVSAILSRENWQQIWIPAGFAHGYCTLEADTEIIYKLTDRYDPAQERGLRFDDPALAIAWPVGASEMILVDRDRRWPDFDALPAYFDAAGGDARDAR